MKKLLVTVTGFAVLEVPDDVTPEQIQFDPASIGDALAESVANGPQGVEIVGSTPFDSEVRVLDDQLMEEYADRIAASRRGATKPVK